MGTSPWRAYVAFLVIGQLCMLCQSSSVQNSCLLLNYTNGPTTTQADGTTTTPTCGSLMLYTTLPATLSAVCNATDRSAAQLSLDHSTLATLQPFINQYRVNLSDAQFELIPIPQQNCTQGNTAAQNTDGSCNDQPYLVQQLQPSLITAAQAQTLSVWFRWQFSLVAGTAWVPLVVVRGANLTSQLTIFAGAHNTGSGDSACITIELFVSDHTNGYYGRNVWIVQGSQQQLHDDRWHNIMLVQGTVPGIGQLYLDGQIQQLEQTSTSASAANSPDLACSLAAFKTLNTVESGSWYDAILGYKPHYVGSASIWRIALYDSTPTTCEVALWLEADRRVLYNVTNSNLFSYQYIDTWAGVNVSYLPPVVTLVSVGMPNAPADGDNGTYPPSSWYSNMFLTTSLAGVGTNVLAYNNCTDAGYSWNVSNSMPSYCQSWAPDTYLSFTCTMPYVAPPPVPTTDPAVLAARRTTVTAIAATTVAVATTASVGVSAGVSTVASQAVGAVASMGADVGLRTAMASVGVDSLIRRLQLFAVTGGLATNLSESYSNLAQALQWTNFQVDLKISSSSSTGSSSSLVNSADVTSSTGGRRLTSVSDDIISAQNKYKSPQVEQLASSVWSTAVQRLICVGVAFVVLLATHWLALAAWVNFRWLRRRPLPEFLVFPKVELMYWDSSLVGVTQAFAMLLSSAASASFFILSAFAAVYAAAFAAILAVIVSRFLWHMEDVGLEYHVLQPGHERRDKAGKRQLFAFLNRLQHGYWGEDDPSAERFEPRRTTRYLRQGLNPLPLLRLVRAHAALQREMTRQATRDGRHSSVRWDDTGGGEKLWSQRNKIAPSEPSKSMAGMRESDSGRLDSMNGSVGAVVHLKLQRLGSAGMAAVADVAGAKQKCASSAVDRDKGTPGAGVATDPQQPTRTRATLGKDEASTVELRMTKSTRSSYSDDSSSTDSDGSSDGGLGEELRAARRQQRARRRALRTEQLTNDAGAVALNVMGKEIEERFGDMYGDYRGDNRLCASFKAMDLVYRVSTAAIIGWQTGSGAASGSMLAMVLQYALLGVTAALAAALLLLRPNKGRLQTLSDILCALFDTGTMLCSCLLQTMPDNENLQTAMLACALGSLLSSFFGVWLGLLVKVLSAIRLKKKVAKILHDRKEALKAQSGRHSPVKEALPGVGEPRTSSPEPSAPPVWPSIKAPSTRINAASVRLPPVIDPLAPSCRFPESTLPEASGASGSSRRYQDAPGEESQPGGSAVSAMHDDDEEPLNHFAMGPLKLHRLLEPLPLPNIRGTPLNQKGWRR